MEAKVWWRYPQYLVIGDAVREGHYVESGMLEILAKKLVQGIS